MRFKLKEPFLIEKNDKRYENAMNQIRDRGFDDSATWSLFTTIGEMVTPMMKRFLELHQKNIRDDDNFGEDVEKMIKAFELMRDYDEWDTTGTAMNLVDNFKTIEEGLELFKKKWGCLWW